MDIPNYQKPTIAHLQRESPPRQDVHRNTLCTSPTSSKDASKRHTVNSRTLNRSRKNDGNNRTRNSLSMSPRHRLGQPKKKCAPIPWIDLHTEQHPSPPLDSVDWFWSYRKHGTAPFPQRKNQWGQQVEDKAKARFKEEVEVKAKAEVDSSKAMYERRVEENVHKGDVATSSGSSIPMMASMHGERSSSPPATELDGNGTYADGGMMKARGQANGYVDSRGLGSKGPAGLYPRGLKICLADQSMRLKSEKPTQSNSEELTDVKSEISTDWKSTETVKSADKPVEEPRCSLPRSLNEQDAYNVKMNMWVTHMFESMEHQIKRYADYEFPLETLFLRLDRLQLRFLERPWEANRLTCNVPGHVHGADPGNRRRTTDPFADYWPIAAAKEMLEDVKGEAIHAIRKADLEACKEISSFHREDMSRIQHKHLVDLSRKEQELEEQYMDLLHEKLEKKERELNAAHDKNLYEALAQYEADLIAQFERKLNVEEESSRSQTMHFGIDRFVQQFGESQRMQKKYKEQIQKLQEELERVRSSNVRVGQDSVKIKCYGEGKGPMLGEARSEAPRFFCGPVMHRGHNGCEVSEASRGTILCSLPMPPQGQWTEKVAQLKDGSDGDLDTDIDLTSRSRARRSIGTSALGSEMHCGQLERKWHKKNLKFKEKEKDGRTDTKLSPIASIEALMPVADRPMPTRCPSPYQTMESLAKSQLPKDEMHCSLNTGGWPKGIPEQFLEHCTELCAKGETEAEAEAEAEAKATNTAKAEGES